MRMKLNNIPTAGNIFLVGPMGVGKTTIGRQLADVLVREFKDSDREIEERTGATIPLIFELEGEIGFRKRECEIINELTHLQNIILATGGGAILNPENRNWLRERGTVVYLHASADQLLKRTNRSKTRPLLQTENPRAKIEQLLKERAPLYESVADLTVETGRRSVKSVLKEILKRL
jgi:shikimate kinase